MPYKFIKPFILLCLIVVLSSCSYKQDNKQNNMPIEKIIRQPAVAGQFYPADKDELKKTIEKYLSNVPIQNIKGKPRAIMSPHAGYIFSGPVAAYDYKLLQGKNYDIVVIMCNSHTAYFSGIAIDNSDIWKTPLGNVEVDKILAKRLAEAYNRIKLNRDVHSKDHTLEVQLPFLQTVLKPGFKILPILFGNEYVQADYINLANLLNKYLKSRNYLIIASSDMSHYPSYDDSNKYDEQVLNMIMTKDVDKLSQKITELESLNVNNIQTFLCGIDGVKTIMQLANLNNWQGKILKHANSGDVLAGDKSSVVGYGALVFFEEENNNLLNKEQQKLLLNIAKESVNDYILNGIKKKFKISDEQLQKKQGAFVTLHKDGKLRGCIGQIISTDKPLWLVVRDMAIAAATEDNRFLPVNKQELNKLDYEISVLSKPKKIDNWQDIELGKDGVIVKYGLHSGVFLPQVAEETHWDKETFLSQLCSQKAGLSPDCYKDSNVELLTFRAQIF